MEISYNIFKGKWKIKNKNQEIDLTVEEIKKLYDKTNLFNQYNQYNEKII